MLEQAQQAPPTVTANWEPLEQIPIHGVQVKEIKNVVIRAGVLTECFRPEWFDEAFTLTHLVYMHLLAGGLTSWHFHRGQHDIILPVSGQVRIGLYDERPDSPSFQRFKLLHISSARPTAVCVPPLVWHAIKNPTSEPAAYIVLNDQPYQYEEPDDWTLPPGSAKIPYSLD